MLIFKGVTYLDSEWALNPIVHRDVPVSDLLASIGGNAFPERRKLLVDLLDIDECWHMHTVSDGYFIHCFKFNYRRTSSSSISNGLDAAMDDITSR